MTTLEIVNRALALVGCPPAASLIVTDRNSYRAILAYTRCRDEVMRLVPWPSSVSRVRLKNMNDQATPWTASHYYGIGQRCTNDTSKTYQCITAGTSAASGGPTGTTSSITDGTAVWAYIEASTAANNWCHKGSTAYSVNDLVTWDTGKVYCCIIAGTTAAATPPTGTSAAIADGTVTWRWYITPPVNYTVYTYQYIYPPDCLYIIKIPNQAEITDKEQGIQYAREGLCIYCDQDDAYIKYIWQEADPYGIGPWAYDSLVQEVLVLRIALEIAFDITGKTDLAAMLLKQYQLAYEQARKVSLSEGSEGPIPEVRWEDV